MTLLSSLSFTVSLFFLSSFQASGVGLRNTALSPANGRKQHRHHGRGGGQRAPRGGARGAARDDAGSGKRMIGIDRRFFLSSRSTSSSIERSFSLTSSLSLFLYTPSSTHTHTHTHTTGRSSRHQRSAGRVGAFIFFSCFFLLTSPLAAGPFDSTMVFICSLSSESIGLRFQRRNGLECGFCLTLSIKYTGLIPRSRSNDKKPAKTRERAQKRELWFQSNRHSKKLSTLSLSLFSLFFPSLTTTTTTPPNRRWSSATPPCRRSTPSSPRKTPRWPLRTKSSKR